MNKEEYLELINEHAEFINNLTKTQFEEFINLRESLQDEFNEVTDHGYFDEFVKAMYETSLYKGMGEKEEIPMLSAIIFCS